MLIPILCPLWGNENIEIDLFMEKIRLAGYDGIDTWVPERKKENLKLSRYLDRYSMLMVAHQYRADGSTFKRFRASYLKNLEACSAMRPLLINSHTGRDYFKKECNMALIEDALEFTAKTGIQVAHETHRGRFGFSPGAMADYFATNGDFAITADFSHWTCVSESMLKDFGDVMEQAIKRSKGIHARVGFEQGPQIPDPRDPAWKYALDAFFGWWDAIVSENKKQKTQVLPITTEFGPFPYLMNHPFSDVPISDQFEINLFMKGLLRNRYQGRP